MEPTLKKKIRIVMGCAAVLILIIAVQLASNASKTDIIITVSPMNSAITIDGKPAKSGKNKVSKGKHSIVATREHFHKETVQIDTASLTESKPVFVILQPSDAEGEAYLTGNHEEQLIREDLSGKDFSTTQERVADKYPFTASLPYETIDYKIDYLVTNTQDIKLLVTLYIVATVPGTPEFEQEVEQFKASALKYLKNKGIDTNTIPIEFTVPTDS